MNNSIELKSARISYSEYGPTHAPTLVFVHGNSGSRKTFAPQLSGPLSEKFHLLALDLPGHGGSTLNPSAGLKHSLPTYVKVLCEFLAALKVSRPILVGHSLGGHVVLEAMEEIPSIRGVCAFGTPPLASPLNLGEVFVPSDHLGLFFSGAATQEQAENAVSLLFGAQPPSEEVRQLFVEEFMYTNPMARLELAQSVAELQVKDEVSLLARTKTPLCLILGRHERVANLAYVQTLKSPMLWRGQLQIIEDAGHLPTYETTAQFDSLLSEFANSLPL